MITDDVERIYGQLTDPTNGRLCSPVALLLKRQSPETDGMLRSLILSVLACERWRPRSSETDMRRRR